MKHTGIEGVNLGGWLLVERWMTPSLFKGTDAPDEYSLMQLPDGKRRVNEHRESFITEEDWCWLAKNNITHVRLPIGYWALHDDPPFVNAKQHLDWAFEMAEKYQIQILLDIHGLKGSQNGTMHSGVIGVVAWQKHFASHLESLRRLARRYRDSPSLWGIEIINEPKVPGHYFALLRYYRKAYKLLRTELRPGTRTVFQDGFAPLLFAGALWPRRGYPVIMDTHFYMLPGRLFYSQSPQMYDKIRGIIYGMTLLFARLWQPVIVGEWSSLLPQPMFDRQPKSQHRAMLTETIARQRRSYRHAVATFYWNYKTESRGMYHFRSLVEDGDISVSS